MEILHSPLMKVTAGMDAVISMLTGRDVLEKTRVEDSLVVHNRGGRRIGVHYVSGNRVVGPENSWIHEYDRQGRLVNRYRLWYLPVGACYMSDAEVARENPRSPKDGMSF